MEVKIDDLLLYSKCPMRFFFERYLGAGESVLSLRGQVTHVLRDSCRELMMGADRAQYARAESVKKLNNGLVGIYPPSDARGAGSSRDTYMELIQSARSTLDMISGEIIGMGLRPVMVPFAYNITINNKSYLGVSDGIMEKDGMHYVIVLDLGRTMPSDFDMDHSVYTTIASFAYTEVYRSDRYKLVHYWVPGNAFIEVHRTPGDHNAIWRELNNIAKIVDSCLENGEWYRSRGFWCNSCSVREPCSEVRY